MPLSKEQLVFFPGDNEDSDNVGAYVTDASGNLITSTLISGHQALDVNVANSITTTPVADVDPATQNITAQDTSSTTTTGANNQSIITGSPTAGSTASFTFATKTSVRMQVTGTWTGTLQSEVSLDGGTTWYVQNIHQNGTSFTGSSWTANFEGITTAAAATTWRLRATAAWTGTATVQIIESTNEAYTYVGNPLKLVDATTTNVATVKAPSTAAVATDTALVVAVSPNNTIGVTQSTSPWVDNLTQVGGSSISLGQNTSANSLPVVIALDQSAINVAQSGTWTVQQGTPPWSVVGNIADGSADSGDPVKTGTRALVGVGPSAIGANNDRADMISDVYRRLYVNDGADTAVKNQSVTVTNTAAAFPTPLAGRRSLMVQNLGNKAIYIGSNSSVTTSNGLSIPPSSTLEVSLGPDVNLYAITSSGSQSVVLFEMA
jgi:hypothetical protein